MTDHQENYDKIWPNMLENPSRREDLFTVAQLSGKQLFSVMASVNNKMQPREIRLSLEALRTLYYAIQPDYDAWVREKLGPRRPTPRRDQKWEELLAEIKRLSAEDPLDDDIPF